MREGVEGGDWPRPVTAVLMVVAGADSSLRCVVLRKRTGSGNETGLSEEPYSAASLSAALLPLLVRLLSSV